jgi:hypothetical protein
MFRKSWLNSLFSKHRRGVRRHVSNFGLTKVEDLERRQLLSAGPVLESSEHPSAESSLVAEVRMYRAYHPTADDHFFTTSRREFDNAVAHGYQDETTGKAGFTVLDGQAEGTKALLRLYNRSSGDHYYTANANECDALVRQGWTFENVEGYVYEKMAGADTTQLFHLYNRQSGSHLYTENPYVRNEILESHADVWKEHSSLGFAQGVDKAGLRDNFTVVDRFELKSPDGQQSIVLQPHSEYRSSLQAEIVGTLRIDEHGVRIEAIGAQFWLPCSSDLQQLLQHLNGQTVKVVGAFFADTDAAVGRRQATVVVEQIKIGANVVISDDQPEHWHSPYYFVSGQTRVSSPSFAWLLQQFGTQQVLEHTDFEPLISPPFRGFISDPFFSLGPRFRLPELLLLSSAAATDAVFSDPDLPALG